MNDYLLSKYSQQRNIFQFNYGYGYSEKHRIRVRVFRNMDCAENRQGQNPVFTTFSRTSNLSVKWCDRVTNTAIRDTTKSSDLSSLIADRSVILYSATFAVCLLTGTTVFQAVQVSAEVLAGTLPAEDWKRPRKTRLPNKCRKTLGYQLKLVIAL